MLNRVVLARVFAVVAFVCGLLGLVGGLLDRPWKLGAVGWFGGGVLLAVLAVFLLAEEYVVASRRRAG